MILYKTYYVKRKWFQVWKPKWYEVKSEIKRNPIDDTELTFEFDYDGTTQGKL
jgi:hypothetical protein